MLTLLIVSSRKGKRRKVLPYHYFPAMKITRLNHGVKDDLPHMDRYENKIFGLANVLDPPV
jgi:hypothetical protein